MTLNTEVQNQSPKGVLRKKCSYKFWKIHRKTCIRVFFHKVVDLRPATLLKKRLWHRCFSREFWEICKSTFFIEHLRCLLLSIRLSTTKMVLLLGCRWQYSISSLKYSSILLNRQHKWVINLIFPLIQD